MVVLVPLATRKVPDSNVGSDRGYPDLIIFVIFVRLSSHVLGYNFHLGHYRFITSNFQFISLFIISYSMWNNTEVATFFLLLSLEILMYAYSHVQNKNILLHYHLKYEPVYDSFEVYETALHLMKILFEEWQVRCYWL
jgi:hypothetical protein